MVEQRQIASNASAFDYAYAVSPQSVIKVGNRAYAVTALYRWAEQTNRPVPHNDRLDSPIQPMPPSVLAAYSDCLD